jgi:hypothetical protein
MRDDELRRLQLEVADEMSRRQVERAPRPGWQTALDDLCVANYGNPDFWLHLRQVTGGGCISDDDLNLARQFYAGKCRICGEPMHLSWTRCVRCNADNRGPEMITSTVVTVVPELE